MFGEAPWRPIHGYGVCNNNMHILIADGMSNNQFDVEGLDYFPGGLLAFLLTPFTGFLLWTHVGEGHWRQILRYGFCNNNLYIF